MATINGATSTSGRPSGPALSIELYDSDNSKLMWHMLQAGLTLSAVVALRMYRASKPVVAPKQAGPPAPQHGASPSECAGAKQHPVVSTAELERQLEAARAELAHKDEQLRQLQEQAAQLRCAESDEVVALRARLRSAQEEVMAAGLRCREASDRMGRASSELSVTETELRMQRSQMQAAAQQLQELQSRLEDTEGELGLTRSQNVLMQREIATLRRQLREAGEAAEGHMAARGAAGWGRGERGGDVLATAWE